MNETEWRTFLTGYSRELLANEEVRDRLPPEVMESGWLGYPPASEEEITAAEERLGTRLPPSYRSFLRVSNGWRNPSAFIDDLWPCADVALFPERNQQWIDAYVEPADDSRPLSDAEYLVYGDAQDTCKFRAEYLRTALEISDTGDDAIMLLNPKVVTPDGEWEAWVFANWFPGARRYRSFPEMMADERQAFLELTQKPAVREPSNATNRKKHKPWWRSWYNRPSPLDDAPQRKLGLSCRPNTSPPLSGCHLLALVSAPLQCRSLESSKTA